MPSNCLIICRSLLFLPSIFPSIKVFSSESALCLRWSKCWSFSFSISPSVVEGLLTLPGPEVGLLSNTRKRIVRGDTCWQSKRFYWERAAGWRAVGKGTQENCSAKWLTVLDFMLMGLVSGWSLANHSNSESFLVVHALLSQEGFWEVDGQVVFPLDPNASGWWWLISSVL